MECSWLEPFEREIDRGRFLLIVRSTLARQRGGRELRSIARSIRLSEPCPLVPTACPWGGGGGGGERERERARWPGSCEALGMRHEACMRHEA